MTKLTQDQISTAISVIQSLMNDELNASLNHSLADVNLALEYIAGDVEYEEVLMSPNHSAVTQNINTLSKINCSVM